MSTKNELDAVKTVALAKLVGDTAARKASAGMAAGEYPVDFTVRVTGSIKRGDDYDGEIVEKAEPWKLLAVALSKLNGVTVDSIVREALTAPDELVDGLKDKANDAIKAVKAPTVTRCNGKVTTKLEVALV